MRLLLTGFRPWATHTVNPSEVSVQAAAARLGPAVVAASLPVDYHGAREKLWRLLDELQPTHCLSMGLAPIDHFRIEHLARKPEQFADLAGAETYEAAWPWESVRAVLAERGVGVEESRNAGQYVCESTYWSLLDYRARTAVPLHAGFLHVPGASAACPVAETVEHVVAVVRALLIPAP